MITLSERDGRHACRWPLAHMMLIKVHAGTKVHTVGVGVAIGQACMLLAAGHKGKRFMLPHATGTHPQLRCLLACCRRG